MASNPGERSRTPSSDAGGSAELQRIGVAAVQLGALGPALARLAEDMSAHSRDQAARAKAVADNMEQLAQHLDAATRELRGSSSEVERALATVARIADHTRILAINASIEANRAGEHGRPFAIVVEEVQRLADRTAQTTDEIEHRVQDMHASITRVTAITDHTHDTAPQAWSGARDAEPVSVDVVNRKIRGIADSAHQQLASVQSLKAMGAQMRAGTESLLLAVGTFRFTAHARAESEVTQLARELSGLGRERSRLEAAMERWIERHAHFELVYLTNANGRQIVDNIVGEKGRVRRDAQGFDRDWAGRPWYRRAIVSPGACSTDIYRSSATGDFCFTIAVALRDPAGQIRGVLAADVNFQQLVAR